MLHSSVIIEQFPYYRYFLKYFKNWYSRLTTYIDKHNSLSNYKFVIKKGYSTYMVLTILIDKITSAIDKGEHIIGFLFRFRQSI